MKIRESLQTWVCTASTDKMLDVHRRLNDALSSLEPGMNDPLQFLIDDLSDAIDYLEQGIEIGRKEDDIAQKNDEAEFRDLAWLRQGNGNGGDF